MKKVMFSLISCLLFSAFALAQDTKDGASTQKTSKKVIKMYAKGKFPKQFSEDTVFDSLSDSYTKVLEQMGGDLSTIMLSYDDKDKELTIMLMISYPTNFNLKEFTEKAKIQTQEVMKQRKIAIKEIDIQI